MFQKYHSNSIVTKFIKCLLQNTHVPTVQIWRPGKALVKGLTYVTKNYIVKAKKDFMVRDLIIKTDNESLLPKSASEYQYCILNDEYRIFKNSNWDTIITEKEALGPQIDTDLEYFDVLEPYVEGEEYFGITSNYISNTSSYDAETHEYLGNYLRMHRDLHNIDLMSYYNCWNGSYSDTIRFETVNNTSFSYLKENANGFNDGKKVLTIPIKFNQKYTLFINSNYPIHMFAGYYDGIKLIRNKTFSPMQLNHCSYTNPYLFEGIKQTGENIPEDGYGQLASNILLEEYLTLFIEVPFFNSGSVLVLEGDYTNLNLINIRQNYNQLLTDIDNKYIDPENVDINLKTYVNNVKTVYFGTFPAGEKLSDNDILNYCKTPSSLTRVLDEKSYAFNDRLVEYLLWNVIDSNDSIDKNIERIQKYVTSRSSEEKLGSRYKSNNYTVGVWDNELRKYIFDLVTKIYKDPVTIDINGFVDKDTESILLRGKV